MIFINAYSKIKRVKLKYASDKTLIEKLEILFIKDHKRGKQFTSTYSFWFNKLRYCIKIAIKFRIFNSICKLLTCILYVLEVVMNDKRVFIDDDKTKKYSFYFIYN